MAIVYGGSLFDALELELGEQGDDEPRTSRAALEQFKPGELAREVSGRTGRKLPARGTEARRRYDVLYQAIRRGRNRELGQGQARRLPTRLERRVVNAARRLWRGLQGPGLERLRRDGLECRITGWFRISKVREYRAMPADAAGGPRYVHIAGDELAEVISAIREAELDRAADELEHAFWAAYGMDEEIVEIAERESAEARIP